MPIAKFTNTSARVIKLMVEGGEHELRPGDSIAGNFSDEEWKTAKTSRQYHRVADELDRHPENEKTHRDTINADKAWVAWREENNRLAAKGQ